MRKHDHNALKQHIKAIQLNITNDAFSDANKIINAMNSPSLQTFSNREFLDLQYWHKITYTDDRKYFNAFSKMYIGFLSDNNPLIKCMFYFVNHANHFKSSLKIIAPILDNEPFAAFHNYKLGFIYVPFKDFSYLDISILIHEIGHYMVYKKFNNSGYLFKKGDVIQSQKYDLAATRTLCKIGELIKFKCDYTATESFTSLKVANDLLQNSSITLFNYNAKLKYEKYSSKIKNETLDFIIQKLNIFPSLINELGAHKAINATVNKMVKDLELTPDLLVILERIADYISRGQDHYYLFGKKVCVL